MLKIVAILILPAQLQLALEVDSGWLEQSFANSAEGAIALVDFVEATVDEDSAGRVVVGRLDEDAPTEHLLGLFADAGVAHAMVSAADIQQAAAANKVATTSAMAVAHADIARFGFLTRRKP